jgi:tetratricopeptide (TPR) repeat protein
MLSYRCWVAAGIAALFVIGGWAPKQEPEPPRRTGPGLDRRAAVPEIREVTGVGGVTIETLRAAIKKDPSKARLQFELAFLLHRSGRTDEAINYYRNAAAIKHDYFQPRFNLGRLYMARKNHAEAAKWFGRAAEVKPEHFECRYNHALTLIYSKQYEAAEKALAAAVEIGKMPGRVHYLRAVVSLRRGQPALALKSYRAAAKAGHATAEVWARIGYLLMGQKKNRQAEAALRKALVKDPNHGLALANLGGILMRKGKIKRALPYLQRAAKVLKKGVGIRVNLGLALLRLKRYRQSLRPLEEAYRLKPGLGLLQIAYGVSLLFDGKTSKGSKLIAGAVRAKKSMTGLLGGYLAPLVKKKKLDGAIELLKAILIGQPDNRVAKKNLLILLRQRGD